MVMQGPTGTQNYLYLYDLPKNETSSARLASCLQQKTGIVLTRMPQIRRDLNRPFYSAIMTIPEEDKFNQACKELRYFELAEGKPSRALPFDNDLLGSNPQKIVDHNIFVRKVPKEMTPQNLEEHFSKYGDIKSLKISLDSDHQSRGYGFVCFQEPGSAMQALEADSGADSCQVIRYQPRDKRDFRKIFNNIYAKNFPDNFTEADVRSLFEQHGRIESMKFMQNPKGTFAFICYNSEDRTDREYGPKCAAEAVAKLNGLDNINGVTLPENKRLYVKEALKKSDREAERLRETIKYKSSKKRCNLYVKGFPDNMTEDALRDLFKQYGEIESLRMHPPEEEKKLYAFVCFQKPDQAASAKENLTINHKTLTINYYEIKEIRKLQNEAALDKQDFQTFRQQHSHQAQWTELANQEEIQFYLKMLLDKMPMLMGRAGGPPRMGGQVPGGPRNFQNRPGGPMRQNNRNYNGMNNRQNMHGNPQAMGAPNMQMNPQMMAAQHQMMGGQQPQPVAQAPPQPPQVSAQMTLEQRYLIACQQLIYAVVPENPNYKEQVGTCFFDFIKQIAGPDKAPKVTGMLIDLPIDDIKLIMQDFGLLQTRVQQASELLDQQPATQ